MSPRTVRRGAAVIAGASGALVMVAAAALAAGDGSGAPAVLRTAATPAPAEATAPPDAVVPDRGVADAAGLVKAVRLAEQQTAQADAERREAEVRRPAEVVDAPQGLDAGCDASTSGLGAVKSWVRDAAQVLSCRFGEPTMSGVAGRGGPSDHPDGLALDFMVDRGTGDGLAACVLANRDALGVKYVIWKQRIDTGDGWEGMEDRGGATANHMDHVHISFEPRAGSGAAPAC